MPRKCKQIKVVRSVFPLAISLWKNIYIYYQGDIIKHPKVNYRKDIVQSRNQERKFSLSEKPTLEDSYLSGENERRSLQILKDAITKPYA